MSSDAPDEPLPFADVCRDTLRIPLGDLFQLSNIINAGHYPSISRATSRVLHQGALHGSDALPSVFLPSAHPGNAAHCHVLAEHKSGRFGVFTSEDGRLNNNEAFHNVGAQMAEVIRAYSLLRNAQMRDSLVEGPSPSFRPLERVLTRQVKRLKDILTDLCAAITAWLAEPSDEILINFNPVMLSPLHRFYPSIPQTRLEQRSRNLARSRIATPARR